MRGILEALVAGADRVTVVDMEAGLEHLKRGTARHVDAMLIVMEPYYRSLETGARIRSLAAELGIGRIYGIANKVSTSGDQEAISEFCDRQNLELLASVPYDEAVMEAERAAKAPIDHAPTCPALVEIEKAAQSLLQATV